MLTDAVAAGSAGLACYGIGAATGAGVLPVIVGLTVDSPWAFSLMRRWVVASDPTGHAESRTVSDWPEAEVIGCELAVWTDPELYAVWCATGSEVLRAPQSHRTATAAQARQHLVSEIERRYPAETAAWLTADGALTGELPRFVVSKGSHVPAARLGGVDLELDRRRLMRPLLGREVRVHPDDSLNRNRRRRDPCGEASRTTSTKVPSAII